jgi:flagellar hook-basal body complex protein FliE
MAPIAPIQMVNPANIQPAALPPSSPDPAAGSVFQTMFTDAVNTVENFQSQAGAAIQNLLSGANEDVHTPVIAAQRANLSFQLFMQVRNKVVSAYQSLMGMQL